MAGPPTGTMPPRKVDRAPAGLWISGPIVESNQRSAESLTRGSYDVNVSADGYLSQTFSGADQVQIEANCHCTLNAEPVMLMPAGGQATPAIVDLGAAADGPTAVRLFATVDGNVASATARFLAGPDAGSLAATGNQFPIAGDGVEIETRIDGLTCDTVSSYQLEVTTSGETLASPVQVASSATCNLTDLVFEDGFE